MSDLIKRSPSEASRIDIFDRFDRMFDELTRRTPWWPWPVAMAADQMIRVDEYRDGGELVIRAELPGIDPDKDVTLTVSRGTLRIEAERHREEKAERRGYLRHELSYGSLTRTLPLPDDVSDSDVTASYQDGILEIHIHTPESEPARTIPIARS